MDYSQFKKLEFRRKFFKIAGASIFITDPATQQEVGYIKMKAWKLRESVGIFTDRSQTTQVAQISARQIITLGATYDVTDSATQQQLFSMRRKALRSAFVRDHWDLLDNAGNVFGTIQETSGTLALARRWLEILPYGDLIGLVFSFVPQTYDVRVLQQDGSSALAANITHRKNPIIVKMLVDTTVAQVPVHPLVILAGTAELSIIDAVKNN